MMDQIKALRTFVRIIDEGSFSGAARAINVTTAVVTETLSNLEEHLGTPLLNRTTRGFKLTDPGKQYLERARAILADPGAEAVVSSVPDEPRGIVRLQAPAAFAIHQLTKHLPRFHAQYPGIAVEVSTLDTVDLVDEEHDLTVLWGPKVRDENVTTRPLALSKVVLSASPEYLDRHGRPSHPSDLTRHAALLPPCANGEPGELTLMKESSEGEPPNRELCSIQPNSHAPLRTRNGDLNYAGALAGLGICGLPSFVVEDALMESALERVLPQWQLSELTLWVGMPSREPVPARTRALLDFLVSTFGGQEADPWLAR